MYWKYDDIESLLGRQDVQTPSFVRLRPGSVELVEGETRVFSDPEALWSFLGELDVAEGWLMSTGQVAAFENGSLPSDMDTYLLAGEILCKDNRTVHLGLEGNSWVVRSFVTSPDGEGVVVEKLYLLEGAPPDRRVRYHVGWAPVTTTGAPDSPWKELRPVAYRFAGFVEEGREEDR